MNKKGIECLRRGVMLIGLGIWFSGCATHSIWEGPLLDNFHEPAKPSRLAVYQVAAKGDFLVQYDDLSPSRDLPVPRAYYLEQNRAQTLRARRPKFVNIKAISEGVPVPVFDVTNVNSRAGIPVYVVQENHQRFSVYGQGNHLIGDYELPTYPTGVGPVKRVLLTPITLALDATVVGGYAFLYLAPCLAGNLSSIR